jgi:putative ABC transport system permease protein
VLVNQAAAKKLGFENAVGKKLMLVQGDGSDIDFKILGVVKDFNYKSLHSSIKPLVMIYANNRYTHLSVQVNPDQIDKTLSYVENKWSQFVKETPFNYSFLENDWAAKYRQEKKASTIFKIFSLLAIAISCLGLFGLASFMAEQRTKEIGVRKVFGASVPKILQILSKEVIILMIISTVIAWPVGYYFMNQWLQGFAYRIDMSLFTFLVASFVTFSIALLTISYRAYNAAVVNPAESLRDE